eukprot:g7119.t1
MSVPELGPGEVCPRRFGLNYDPPAIILEYLEVSTGKLFHRKVAMKRLRASTDPARIAEKLRQVNRPLLTEEPSPPWSGSRQPKDLEANHSIRKDNGVAFEQIVSLVKKLQEAMQKYSTMDSSADLSPGSEEIDYHEANLNKLSDDELARHKARMNSSFLANQMKPGDNGYVYDVRADFDAEQSCGWDSDEDEDDEDRKCSSKLALEGATLRLILGSSRQYWWCFHVRTVCCNTSQGCGPQLGDVVAKTPLAALSGPVWRNCVWSEPQECDGQLEDLTGEEPYMLRLKVDDGHGTVLKLRRVDVGEPYLKMATSQKQIARRVAVLLEGSRGDCQPYMVGALALQNAGYDVTVFGTTDCEAMAKLLGGTPGKQKEIHRAKNVAAVLGKIQSLKPELMICAGLNLSDCISVGRVLSIPVIYLSLQPEEQVGSDFGSTEECTRLEDFLKTCRQAGEEPVYVGYGSMIFESGKYMTLLSLRALRLANKRGVLLGGWAACSADDVENEPDTEELKAFCKEKVLFMDSAPHGRLFPHCQVIVHHGGAGTLYAAAMSGKPMVVVPVLMDQFVHSELVNQKQIGVGLKSMKSTTPNDLAAAISLCSSSSEIQQKAKALAEELAKEDGAKRLVEEVNGFFRDFIDTGCYVQKKNELNTRRSTMGWLKSLANLCSFC